MNRPPPESTHTGTLFPCTTLVRNDAAPVYKREMLAQAFVLIVLNDDQSFGIVADGPAMRIQAIGTTNSIHVAMRPHLKAADIGRFAIHTPHGEGAVALA